MENKSCLNCKLLNRKDFTCSIEEDKIPMKEYEITSTCCTQHDTAVLKSYSYGLNCIQLIKENDLYVVYWIECYEVVASEASLTIMGGEITFDRAVKEIKERG